VGGRSSFEAFFAAHHAEIVRTLTVALGDQETALDAAQEAFAAAYRRWRRVQAMDRPVGWVYVTAVHAARRARRREAARPGADWMGSELPGDDTEALPAVLDLTRAVDELAPRQRLAITLRYLGDLEVADVAAAMAVTPGTAKATIHQALARLRVGLDPADDLFPEEVEPS
jgi:RNA polymerase sigma factor (sigma-70 family)